MKTDLRILWDLLPHPEGSVVRWFARRDSQTAGDYAETLDELATAMSLYSDEGWNCYIQPNPTSQRFRSRSSTVDVTHWSFLYLDIDPVENDYDAFNAFDKYLVTLEKWLGCNFAVNPVTVIDSGRGIQGWIRLDDLVFDDSDPAVHTGEILVNNGEMISLKRETARKSMGYWLKGLASEVGTVYGCRLDTSCSDLPRVMRCPGTVNQKTGRMASIFLSGVPHRGLSKKLVVNVPEDAFYTPPVAATNVNMKWQQAMPMLTLTASNFLRHGHEEPGRHKAAVATAFSLRDKGVSKDEALKALVWGNRKCVPQLSEVDLRRAVESAYGK